MKQQIITVKDIITQLEKYPQNAQFLVGSDEELNNLYWGFEISRLIDKKPRVVIYGLSNQIIEDEY